MRSNQKEPCIRKKLESTTVVTDDIKKLVYCFAVYKTYFHQWYSLALTITLRINYGILPHWVDEKTKTSQLTCPR